MDILTWYRFVHTLTPDEFEKLQKDTRALRVVYKESENENKPPLDTPDVVNADDFKYEPFVQSRDFAGDSGSLLLATRKNNPACRYIVKHAYTDCAANEFIYSKMARALGLKIPQVVLFRLSNPLDDSLFKTEYVAGIEYLNVVDARPTIDAITSAKNGDDYYKFLTLQKLFHEVDTFEFVLAEDGFVYRIDTTASFRIDDIQIAMEGATPAPKRMPRKKIAGYWNAADIADYLWNASNHYGMDKADVLASPIYEIPKIPKAHIDGFLDTLRYFYPEHVGKYYSIFFEELRKTLRDTIKYLSAQEPAR